MITSYGVARLREVGLLYTSLPNWCCFVSTLTAQAENLVLILEGKS